MVIANPMYDVVFKKMLEDNRVAKFFIETFLEHPIETIDLQSPQHPFTGKFVGIAVVRLDYIVTIKTETGERRKVLIEVRKVRDEIHLLRYRNYLSQQNKKESAISDIKTTLPVITIYFLWFDLPGIETPCLKVDHDCEDLINKTTITNCNDFIEQLTHQTFIVQVDRITDRDESKLGKLLNIFEQGNFVDDKRIIKDFHQLTDLKEIKLIIDMLHDLGTQPQEKKKIETEQEAWRSIYALFEDEKEEFVKALKEKDELIAELLRKLNEKK
jgi:hypothetical protein